MSAPAGDGGPHPSIDDEAVPEAGFVAAELREEFPGLGLRYLAIDARTSRTPAHVRGRLRTLSDRFAGAQAINLRHQAIPWAYRVFFRHIGLDPDEQPTPVEQLALERMFHGGFVSHNLLEDAITIGIVESGVALRAFDAEHVTGRLGIRPSVPGEMLARPLPSGTLVVADEMRPLALLFGDPATDAAPTSGTRRAMIVATQVRGVPDIAIEEAVWLAASVVRS
jgi:DNA/RNA-binding domain of Phe-tRNA-synthetase-like protein